MRPPARRRSASARPAIASDPRRAAVSDGGGTGGGEVVGGEVKGRMGGKAGSVEGFTYSAAMRASGIVWDEAKLLAFIMAPKSVVPGTRMTYPGLKDEGKAADIVAY